MKDKRYFSIFFQSLFGKKCEKKECAPRPDNSHLNMDKNICYSEYNYYYSPMCLKKDGEIIERDEYVEKEMY